MRFYLSAAMLFTFVFLSGCQTTSKYTSTIDYFPVSSAVQVNYQDEVNLLRLKQILLDEKELTSLQRANLLYDSAVIYDRMGLSAHSRYYLSQAISVDPLFAPAYNTLGLYLLLNRSYDEAFDAFDSALELSDRIQNSYLHRAFGLYQVKRYFFASQDINKFYDFEPNDPYRILWRYIINSKINQPQALLMLKNAKKPEDDYGFAWSIIDVIAGRVTEKQFLRDVSYNVQSNKEFAERLCEAYFYLGFWHKLSGDLDKAVYYFKLSTTTNIHEFIEYKYALIELSSIQLAATEE